MPPLNLDTLTIPEPIRDKLRELSVSISFDKQSRKGSCGWLFFGTNIVHEQRVAVKFYDWSGDPLYHAEPRYLSGLNSPNVINVMHAAIVDGDFAYFATPFYHRGDLDDEMCRGIHANIRAINLSRDILSGLSHLHAGRLLHRDLKAQNILLSDDDRAVIGDFGSVKRMPDGQHTIPGSGHSLIYRPPESIGSRMYGISSDLYQVGVVMFQLLGGALPYEESAWLNARQLREYRLLPDPIDKQIYAANVIKNRIVRGQIVDINSLPPWVCEQLRRTISKACSIDPQRRYQSCSEFLARIGAIRSDIHDWRVEDGCATRYGRILHRVVHNQVTGLYTVQKRGSGNWRNDNSFQNGNLADLVREIEERNC
ncbi:MAG: protein kinase [Nitrospirae bacterium]|nr:protein kinase [Nitrospirota bacterium]